MPCSDPPSAVRLRRQGSTADGISGRIVPTNMVSGCLQIRSTNSLVPADCVSCGGLLECWGTELSLAQLLPTLPRLEPRPLRSHLVRRFLSTTLPLAFPRSEPRFSPDVTQASCVSLDVPAMRRGARGSRKHEACRPGTKRRVGSNLPRPERSTLRTRHLVSRNDCRAGIPPRTRGDSCENSRNESSAHPPRHRARNGGSRSARASLQPLEQISVSTVTLSPPTVLD